MNISGTIGSTLSVATYKDHFTLTQKKKSLMNSLDFICFQRTWAGTRTIDVVWISSNNMYEQTIDKKEMHTILEHGPSVPTFDIGPDPGKWSKWKKKAIDENWSHSQWNDFLSSIAVAPYSNDEMDDMDDEWKPSSNDEESSSESEEEDSEEEEEEDSEEEDSEEEDSEEDSEEEEAGPAKRRKLK
jgi:nucleosome binding factor SPN SPT16 subunit